MKKTKVFSLHCNNCFDIKYITTSLSVKDYMNRHYRNSIYICDKCKNDYSVLDMVRTVEKKTKYLIKKYNLKCTINNFPDKIDWIKICCEDKLSINFIHIYFKYIRWIELSNSPYLTHDIISKFKNQLKWHNIAKNKHITEKMIERYISKFSFHWVTLCSYRKLSEQFMEKHLDKMVWYLICSYQDLSMDFMRRHSDKINWGAAAHKQNFSESFIIEFRDKLFPYKDIMINTGLISEKRLYELIEKEMINNRFEIMDL